MEFELQPGDSVSLKVLGQPEHQSASAQIVSTSGRRITASTSIDVEVGRAVQIQSPEIFILAEVVSVQESTGIIGVQVRHALQMEAITALQQQWK